MLSVAEMLLMFSTADIKLCLSGLDVCVRACTHACNEPVTIVCACLFCIHGVKERLVGLEVWASVGRGVRALNVCPPMQRFPAYLDLSGAS